MTMEENETIENRFFHLFFFFFKLLEMFVRHAFSPRFTGYRRHELIIFIEITVCFGRIIY